MPCCFRALFPSPEFHLLFCPKTAFLLLFQSITNHSCSGLSKKIIFSKILIVETSVCAVTSAYLNSFMAKVFSMLVSFCIAASKNAKSGCRGILCMVKPCVGHLIFVRVGLWESKNLQQLMSRIHVQCISPAKGKHIFWCVYVMVEFF